MQKSWIGCRADWIWKHQIYIETIQEKNKQITKEIQRNNYTNSKTAQRNGWNHRVRCEKSVSILLLYSDHCRSFRDSFGKL